MSGLFRLLTDNRKELFKPELIPNHFRFGFS